MNIIQILFGVVLLLLGRRLFWVFVAGAGFLWGLFLAREYLNFSEEWQVLLAGLAAGLLGALLAVFLQKLAIGLAGAIAGAYLMMVLFESLGTEEWSWVGLIIGAVVGCLLLIMLFDWALIVLSSLLGALVIVDAVDLERDVELLVFAGALIVGLLAQAAQKRGRRPRRKVEDRRD